jgi:hypothetical protein
VSVEKVTASTVVRDIQAPHSVKGPRLKALVELWEICNLWGPEVVSSSLSRILLSLSLSLLLSPSIAVVAVVKGNDGNDVSSTALTPAAYIPSITGLQMADGCPCTLCPRGLTKGFRAMQRHVSMEHGRKPSTHDVINNPL